VARFDPPGPGPDGAGVGRGGPGYHGGPGFGAGSAATNGYRPGGALPAPGGRHDSAGYLPTSPPRGPDEDDYRSGPLTDSGSHPGLLPAPIAAYPAAFPPDDQPVNGHGGGYRAGNGPNGVPPGAGPVNGHGGYPLPDDSGFDPGPVNGHGGYPLPDDSGFDPGPVNGHGGYPLPEDGGFDPGPVHGRGGYPGPADEPAGGRSLRAVGADDQAGGRGSPWAARGRSDPLPGPGAPPARRALPGPAGPAGAAAAMALPAPYDTGPASGPNSGPAYGPADSGPDFGPYRDPGDAGATGLLPPADEPAGATGRRGSMRAVPDPDDTGSRRRRRRAADDDPPPDRGGSPALRAVDPAPGGRDDDADDDDYVDEPALILQWGMFVLQTIFGAASGLGIWLGFHVLWERYPFYAAAGVGGSVTVMLVVARWLRRRYGHDLDLLTSIIVVGIGVVLTVLPAAFSLQNR
jgi:hypothetical protein